jgi:hypothetical protein
LDNVVLSDSGGNSIDVEVGDCIYVGEEPDPPSAPTGMDADAGDGSVSLVWNASDGADSYNIYREQEASDMNDCQEQGYDYEDCVGFCSNEEDCQPADCLSWVGDGYCDDGTWGLNLNCEEWDFDGGDCEGSNCDNGYVDDCAGDGDCCPESWIGDGYADCEDQAWGCDLTCYDNDGGDCGGNRQDNNFNGTKILSYIE